MICSFLRRSYIVRSSSIKGNLIADTIEEDVIAMALNMDTLTTISTNHIALYRLPRLMHSSTDDLLAYLKAAFQLLLQSYSTIHQICNKTSTEVEQTQDAAVKQKKTDKLRNDLVEPNLKISELLHKSLYGALSRLLAQGSSVQHIRDFVDDLSKLVVIQKKENPLLIANSNRIVAAIESLGQKLDSFERSLIKQGLVDAQKLARTIVKLYQWETTIPRPTMSAFPEGTCILSSQHTSSQCKTFRNMLIAWH